jgi:hypothetical protein
MTYQQRANRWADYFKNGHSRRLPIGKVPTGGHLCTGYVGPSMVFSTNTITRSTASTGRRYAILYTTRATCFAYSFDYRNNDQGRSGGGGGRVVRLHWAAYLKGTKFGGKINILKEKFNFLSSTNFQLLSQIQGN